MRFMVRYDIKIRRKVFETFLKMEDTMDKKVHEIDDIEEVKKLIR